VLGRPGLKPHQVGYLVLGNAFTKEIRMKILKMLVATAVLLLCGASCLAAEPATNPVPASLANEELAPADLFAVSVLSLPADCFAADRSKVETASCGGGLDRSTCGGCSVPVCRFRPVGWLCGIQGGNPKFCQDTYGDVCEDGGAYCRCTDTIVP
jgi:hypothetical protein